MTALILSSVAALLAVFAALILVRNYLVLRIELEAIETVKRVGLETIKTGRQGPKAEEMWPLLDAASYDRKMLMLHRWTFKQFYPTLARFQ